MMLARRIATVLNLFLALAGGIAVAQTTTSMPGKRIAVYDSRAVAVAYCDSPLHRKEMARLREEFKKQQALGSAGNGQDVKRAGQEAQKRLHLQGFGSYPVDDILDRIPEKTAAIKKSAGAIALVSKWNEEELKRYAGAEQVDVTDQLVSALDPTDKQLKYVKDIMKITPVPMDELKKHLDAETSKGI